MTLNVKKQARAALFPWLVWFCAALFYGYQFCLRVSISVIDHDLMRDFAINSCALGSLASWYYVAYASMQVPAGILLDRYGPRRVTCFAIALCSVGCGLFASAQTIYGASVGRLFMGAGSAFGFLGGVSIATRWFPPQMLSTIIGLHIFVGTVGAIGGSAPLSMLTQSLGWRAAIWIVFLIGACLILLVSLIVRDAPSDTKSSSATENALTLLQSLWFIVKKPQVWVIGLYGMMMYLPLSALADLWATPFLCRGCGLDQTKAATVTSCIYIGLCFGAPIWPFVSDYIKAYKPILCLSAITTTSIMLIALLVPGLSVFYLATLFFLLGFFTGTQFLAFTISCSLVPSALNATTSAVHNTVCMISGVVFQPLIGWLLEQSNGISGAPQRADYVWALSILPLATCIGFFLCFLGVRDTYPKRESGDSIE